jgi:hypothetical protein
MKRADVVMIKEGVVKTVLNEESFGERKPSHSGSLQLPGVRDVTGLCLDPTGKPLILATNLGVFEVATTDSNSLNRNPNVSEESERV